MAGRNWGQITSGATFEALVSTLVFFHDSRAALFGRRGKDGGQDCRSGDGLLVYQAKHHEDGAAAKAIADAKSEATKIAEYRKAGNRREKEWRDVACWRLVTNATFNPRDHQTWLDDVVPLFKALHLEATYWERANLDALLDKYPEVDRSFFGNETRVFLSIPEKRERLPQEEPFLPRASSGSFLGRMAEGDAIKSFLKSGERFLVVHGAGGVGKTRLLVEVGEDIAAAGEWQVLWANVASMAASAAWFDGIVPERPTLLCIDEPDDEEILQIVSEQLAGKVGRASKWKVVVAVRSPKDPVVGFLSTPRMKSSVKWLSVDPLTRDAAEGLCSDLLGSGPLGQNDAQWIKEVSTEFVRRFGPYPVWLTLAVHAVENRGDLALVPTDSAGLADLYLEEITSQQRGTPAEQVLELLRWLALAGRLNRENESAVAVIADGCGTKDPTTTLALIARLVDRRALVQRGANDRLVEIKPDVLRDHILIRWLAADVGFGDQRLRPSEATRNLVDSVFRAIPAGLSGFDRSVLTSIARTELLLRFAGQPVPLLDPFYGAIHDALPSATASQRIAFTEVIVDVARVRVLDTVSVSRAMRTNPVAPETTSSMFGPRTVSQDDVILALGWPVYHAAMGALAFDERLAVLEELYELAKAEADIEPRLRRGLPNDGRRAQQLIGQTIAGRKYFWSEFDDAAAALSGRVLAQLGLTPPTSQEADAIRSLINPAVSVERHQAWSEGNKFVWSKQTIMSGHPGWTTRMAVLQQTRSLLEDESVPPGSRLVLWGLLVEAHRLANYAALHGTDEFRLEMRAAFLAELDWALAVLEKRGAPFEEVTAARDLWDWHARYEKDDELKGAALRLEALYTANELAAEFQPLMELDSTEAIDRNAGDKAAALATGDERGIDGFIERGVRFLGTERKFFTLLGVASALGAHADVSVGVRTFIDDVLAGRTQGEQRLEFALVAASRWFFKVRTSSGIGAALELLKRLLQTSVDDATRARLLIESYGVVAPRWSSDEMSEDEHTLLRSQEATFRASDRLPWFVSLIGPSPRHKWSEYKEQIERILGALAEPRRTEAVAALIQGVFWAVRKRDASAFPPDLNIWLLDQVLRVSDFDSLSNMLEWRLEEVLKVLGRVPIAWLPGALKQRSAREKQQGESVARAVSFDIGLSEFVARIQPEESEDPTVIRAVEELLDLVDDGGMVGFRLPDLLREVDPKGVAVPKLLADRMASGGDLAIKKFARLAKSYVVGTPPWRIVATPVLELARKVESREERIGLYHAICEPGVRSWSGTPGTVPIVFVHEVEHARQRRQEETDPRFTPLWDWCVTVAEADLRYQQDRAKEENDEES